MGALGGGCPSLYCYGVGVIGGGGVWGHWGGVWGLQGGGCPPFYCYGVVAMGGHLGVEICGAGETNGGLGGT